MTMAWGATRKTTRKGLRVKPEMIQKNDNLISADTLRGALTEKIVLSGFDKPLRSNYETVFIKNNTTKNISGIVIDCDYTDSQGRQLHKRTVTMSCNIPAGQTRQVRFKSWDTQQTFYYRRSAKPKKATGAVFNVHCQVIAIISPHKAD